MNRSGILLDLPDRDCCWSRTSNHELYVGLRLLGNSGEGNDDVPREGTGKGKVDWIPVSHLRLLPGPFAILERNLDMHTASSTYGDIFAADDRNTMRPAEKESDQAEVDQ